ncbi:membrane protein [Bacteroidia bacterium]|nr:membrane protein [Bacteroidia bacterium]
MFLNFEIKDIIDIFLVAIILYQTYRLMKGTGTANIFIGILSFVVAWFFITRVFEMRLLGQILNSIMSFAPILLIIIFQKEIRSFFFMLGKKNRFFKSIESFFKNKDEKPNDVCIMQVVTACRKLSQEKVGALIIFEKKVTLHEYIETGEGINADISARLIENIFFKNSPLHDGAMIISGDKIKAAGCILPVSHNPNIAKNLGLRHRSALGIAERTDAIAIVVSEETGKISVAENGQLNLKLKTEELENFLSK